MARVRKVNYETVEVNCAFCGKPFTKSAKTSKKTCSSECSKALLKVKIKTTCEVCGKTFEKTSKSVKTTCSRVCRSELGKRNRAKTNLKKFGVENPFASKRIIKKSQEKREKTLMKTHGVKNVSQRSDVRKKIEKTIKEKYGETYTNVSQVPEFKEKISESISRAISSEEVQSRIKSTNMERYGVENVWQSEEIKKKIRKTMFEKYGIGNNVYRAIKNIDDWMNFDDFIKKSGITTLSRIREYFGCSINTVRGKIIKGGLQSYIPGFYSYSGPEKNIQEFLISIGLKEGEDFIPHYRKLIGPKEVDFYLPEHKLAIEVSPTWTHQYVEDGSGALYGFSDKSYHYNKFKACELADVELITIFDWHDTDKIKSFIKMKVSKPSERIYARKCSIAISENVTKVHREFLDANHVLGKVNNKKDASAVELLHNNELVGLGVFYGNELKRLAFAGDIQVVGGSSKILSHYRSIHPEYNELYTFSDNDLGTGAVYKQLGFDLIEENKNGLIWFNELYEHRVSNISLIMQGADRLLAGLPGYQPVGRGEGLPSNQEIIAGHGYTPVFDCGYKKWKLNCVH